MHNAKPNIVHVMFPLIVPKLTPTMRSVMIHKNELVFMTPWWSRISVCVHVCVRLCVHVFVSNVIYLIVSKWGCGISGWPFSSST